MNTSFSLLVLFFGALTSAFLVLRLGWLGFGTGLVVFWGFCYFRSELLFFLDPMREGAEFDNNATLIIAPLVGFVWCICLLVIHLAYQYLRTAKGRPT